jgi:signal peptide peptidase SppA
MRLPHIAARVFGTPLAIHPGKAEIIMSAVILPKLRGEALTPSEMTAPVPQMTVFDLGLRQEALGVRPASRSATPAKASLLPIHGTLVRRTSGLEAESGLLSYDAIRTMLHDSLQDPEIKGILMSIDSPGGEVAGLADLADEIHAANKIKPIFAIADDVAYSAAYWLGSAAEKFYLTQSGSVGSIGVVAMHVDQSKLDEKMGLTYTPIFAGAHKLDYSSHAPLSEEAAKRAQRDVDASYDAFCHAVAKHRGLSTEAIKDTEAGTFKAKEAVRLNLADGMMTFSQAADALLDRISSVSSRTKLRANATGPGKKTMEDDARQGAPEQGAEIQPAPAATASAAPADNVIQLEEVRKAAREQGKKEGITEAQAVFVARAKEITDLCTIAGKPQLAGGFISSGKEVADIRKELLDLKAAEADSAHTSGLHQNASRPAAQKIDPDAIYRSRADASKPQH